MNGAAPPPNRRDSPPRQRARDRRTWLRRAVLVALGATIVPALVLELALRVAACFVDERAPTTSSAARITIACVGDSHTYGVYYPRSCSYPAQLQQILDAVPGIGKVDVIGLGRPGRATAQVREGLDEVLRRYHPDFVVVLAGINDRWNRPESSALSEFLARHSRVWTLVRLLREPTTDDPIASPDGVKRRYTHATDAIDDESLATRVAANLEAIVARARAGRSRPILLTYAPPDAPFAAVDAAIRATAQRADVPLVDLQQVFARELERRDYAELLLPGDFHPVPEGSRIIAREVARKVIELLGADPSAVDRMDADAARSPLRLERAADRPNVLVVHAPARTRFQIVMSSTRSPPGRCSSVALPFAADSTFLLSLRLPFLVGETDAAGVGEVTLPADSLAQFEPGKDGLLAAAFRLRDGAIEENHPLALALDGSTIVEVVPPASPAK